jgi:hypothetical protein
LFEKGMKKGKAIWKKANDGACNEYIGEYLDDMKHG